MHGTDVVVQLKKSRYRLQDASQDLASRRLIAEPIVMATRALEEFEAEFTLGVHLQKTGLSCVWNLKMTNLRSDCQTCALVQAGCETQG